MKRIKKYASLLAALQTLDPKTRANVIRNAPDDFIKVFIELVLNVIRGNISICKSDKEKLKRQAERLRTFASHRGPKGVKLARKQLNQKGGILPFLLPLLGIGAAAIAAPVVAKKVAQSATNSALDTVTSRAQKLINKI